MLSFRTKIFLTYAVLFCLFIAFMLPFVSYQVNHIVGKTLEERASDLIDKIKSAPTEEALVSRLKSLKHQIYFRVSIINSERQILYDSHTKRLLGPSFSQEYIVDHPEVLKALKKGTASSIDYSGLLEQEFYYFAKRFSFHGKPYVMRAAVPYEEVILLSRDFEMGFLLLLLGVLFFFSAMTWFIINHFTRPIRTIIDRLRPYHRGQVDKVPEVTLSDRTDQDEFAQLARTLTRLSHRVEEQISSISRAGAEREAILSSLVEGVLAVDQGLRIIYANSSVRQQLDLPLSGLCDTIIDDEQLPECAGLLRRCQEDSEVMSEVITRDVGGRVLYLNLIAAPMGARAGAVLIVQDLTAQYEMIEMRRDFIANASHELKTPITVVRGFAETLHDNPNLPTEITTSITGRIVSHCERMTELVRDLLVLSDVENLPATRLSNINLEKLLEVCRGHVLERFPTANISIDLGVKSPHVVADARLLELAFTNLIDNAAKYSDPPIIIEVSLRQEESWLVLDFSDHGIGIPEEHLAKIFERFHTVDSRRSQQVGGSGLGLAIVHTIIIKHGGTISVRSKAGEGTTFTIRLPIEGPQPPSR